MTINTTKSQLTPASTLSGLSKFKHFLALSLLITLSFNAFAADNSEQPNKEELSKEVLNKEAYLDLSKPYTHKQSNTTKKDNQATTLLKEVAGTTRAALGSTNSGNTNQLGKKVVTDIKNKAINKTEGFVNNKANTFLNAFGAGRSEVSIGGLSSKKLNYSLRTIQPISELDANSKALTFIQAGITSGKSIDSRRTTVNLGVGHRLLVENDMAIAGINVFTDYESKSKHKRLSLGLEYQRANFSANINKYHVFSDEKLVNSVKEERARSGYDVKLSGQAPYLPWAKIKGTYYYWDTKAGPDIKGNILGVDIEITPSVSFELGQENNNTMDATSYGKLTVKLPLGNKQKFTNFAIASKAFKDSRKMDLGALAWVERSNKIMIEGGDGNTISFKGLTYKLVTSPYTGRVWLDRNLGATKVADSGTDSAAYGDYYQWGRAKDGHSSSTSSATQIQSSDIVSGQGHFIYGWADWTTADSSGALRIAAWADGGKNDICPAGFSVPTEAELKKELKKANSAVYSVSDAASSFLRIPAAGFRDSSASVAFKNKDADVALWVRNTTTGRQGRSRKFSIINQGSVAGLTIGDAQRTLGLSVRCVRDRI